MKNNFIIIILLNFSLITIAQDQLNKKNINILRPSKAAFYSAVFPGLGQVYNRKAWKVPIVFSAIGISGYAYDFNKKKYFSYRNAYKRRLAGFNDDEFQGLILNNERLLDGQDFYRKNKDLSMVFLVGFYFLNILDANIDAHLLDFNVNENLSFEPYFENNIVFEQSVGLKVKMNL